MDEIITFVESAFESPVSAIVGILLFIAAIRGLYEFVSWIKKELNKWYEGKNEEENAEKKLEERVTNIEKDNSLQFEKLSSLEDAVISVNDKLDNMYDSMKESTICTFRAEMLRLWHECSAQGNATQAQMDTFERMAELYLAQGGNGLFRNKIIPEFRAFEIKD